MLSGVIIHELFEIALGLGGEELTEENLERILEEVVYPKHVEEMYLIDQGPEDLAKDGNFSEQIRTIIRFVNQHVV